MDTKDLKNLKIPKLSRAGAFPLIWDLQLQLIEKYQVIEGLPLYPLNLDTKDNQELMKDFLARVTEELAEAYEAFNLGNVEDGKEELADALHFLVEAIIFTTDIKTFQGLFQVPLEMALISKLTNRADGYTSFQYWFWDVTYHLNIARNNLRNKKWKQTQVLAQKALFLANLARAFEALLTGFNLVQMDEKDIFEVYYKKNRINRFRIKSKY